MVKKKIVLLFKRQGFTLVEMSVVLVIIAIITAMGVSAGIEAMESTRRVSTDTKLDVIEEALFNFREKYARLPCPGSATLATTDANYGVEAANMSGTCTGGTPAATYVTVGSPTGVPSGAVPARTLGLPDEFMYDGWGKKIHYEVTQAMTRDNSFTNEQPGDACALTVVDHSGTNLALSPAYALVSYGKNGVGAYLKGGTQNTGGTAGTAEQTNIRTTTNTPTIRFKNGASGAIGTAGYYDDVVRFKSLYQLMDKIQRETPLYRGPEMLLGYNATSGTQILYGKKKCGRFQDFSGTPPAVVATAPKFMGFTPSNSNFFVYHTDGATPSCKLYSIISTTLAAVTETTPVPNCPTAGSVGAMAQNNGMLALNDTAAPYTRVYKLIGSAAAAKFIELANAFSPALASVPENLSLSENGEYLAVSRHTATAYAKLYVKKGDFYQDRGTLPSDAYTEYSNAISPNGKYYAIAVISGSDTQIYVWRNVRGVFSQITSGGSAVLYTVTGMTAPGILTFSADSAYLAVAGASTGNNVVALYLNPVTETLSAAATLTLASPPTALAFSADSMFMGLALPAAGSGSLGLYRRSGATSFSADTSSNLSFNGSANGSLIAFSR